MEQRSDGTFYFGNPVLTYFGHYEGIMGSLQVDHSDGYATVGYKMEPKYFIAGGYGERSGFIDKIKMKIQRNLNANSLVHISDEDVNDTDIHYPPLDGLIWASSATANKHLYVFGGVHSNRDNSISPKVYCMSMREKWKVVKKMSFSRYLHTTKSIGPNRLIHVGGYGQHPVEIWDINENGEFTSNYGKMHHSTAQYTGDEENRIIFFFIDTNDFVPNADSSN